MARNKDINTFTGFNVGKNRIDVGHYSDINYSAMFELRPVELYLKEDGAKGDKPSFAITMIDPRNHAAPIIGELSLEMWNKGLSEVGYEIVKKQNT